MVGEGGGGGVVKFRQWSFRVHHRPSWSRQENEKDRGGEEGEEGVYIFHLAKSVPFAFSFIFASPTQLLKAGEGVEIGLILRLRERDAGPGGGVWRSKG